METSKKKFDWYNLLAAGVMLVIGLVMLLFPGETSAVLGYVVAALVTLAGAARTALYFVRHESVSPFSFGGLSVGLTLLAVGILLLIDPLILLKALNVAVGVLLIFSGFGSLQTAVSLMRLKIARWYLPLLFALVSIVCGVLALLNPFAAAGALMLFLGVSLVAQGVLMLVSLFLFRSSL